jgi:hypothetical protein
MDIRVRFEIHELSVVMDCWAALGAVNTYLPGVRVGFMSQSASKHPYMMCLLRHAPNLKNL